MMRHKPTPQVDRKLFLTTPFAGLCRHVLSKCFIALLLITASWPSIVAAAPSTQCLKLAEVVAWYGGYTSSETWAWRDGTWNGNGTALDESYSMYFDNPISQVFCETGGSTGVIGSVGTATAQAQSYLKACIAEGCPELFTEQRVVATKAPIKCIDQPFQNGMSNSIIHDIHSICQATKNARDIPPENPLALPAAWPA